MLGTHVQMQCKEISLKIEKEGKHHGKNPPPKRKISAIKKDAWMDEVIKTPPLWKNPPPKREISTIKKDA